MASRICPTCDIELTVIEHAGIEADECPDCKGLWFEQGELARVQLAAGCYSTEFSEKNIGERSNSPELSCCNCNTTLFRYRLIKEFQAEIDLCRQCNGVWVERAELEQVANARKTENALRELEFRDECSSIDWLFQFFTQMPIEYNLPARKVPWVTYTLILINLLIFAYMLIWPWRIDNIFDDYALIPTLVIEGEHSWSLFTNMFLHGGYVHLLGNMYFLYIIGDNLEDVLGSFNYLILYILCGLSGNLFHLALYFESSIPTIGASGAISGLFAMYLLWFRHARLSFMALIFQTQISAQLFFLIWLLMNIAGILFSDDSSIAYEAHIGGFACGLLIGYLLRSTIKKKVW